MIGYLERYADAVLEILAFNDPSLRRITRAGRSRSLTSAS
jgi:hypothetical protein